MYISYKCKTYIIRVVFESKRKQIVRNELQKCTFRMENCILVLYYMVFVGECVKRSHSTVDCNK